MASGSGHGNGDAADVPCEQPPATHAGSLARIQSIPGSDLSVVRFIGEGASGKVYQAEWRGVPVAIKKNNEASTEQQNRRIEKEANIAEIKKHRNLVTTYGICQTPYCLVMDLFINGSLDEMIHSNDPVKQEVASSLVWRLKAAEDIASALDRMQQPPAYIHRDIKPSNVFVCSHHSVKLGDFDRAKSLEEVNRDIAIGAKEPDRLNMAYHAPEVVQAYWTDRLSGFSLKSDVFSFGLLLRELLDFKPIHEMAIIEIDGVPHPFVDEERCKAIGDWYPCAEPIFDVERDCVKYDPRDRPDFSVIHSRIKKIREDVEAAKAEKESVDASRPDANDPTCTVGFTVSVILLLSVFFIALIFLLIESKLNWICLFTCFALAVTLGCIVHHHLPVYYRDRLRNCFTAPWHRLTLWMHTLWETLVVKEVVPPLNPRLRDFPPPNCWPTLREGLLAELPLLTKDRKAMMTAFKFCKGHAETCLSAEDWLELKQTVFRSAAVMNTEAWKIFERESRIHDFVINDFQTLNIDPFAAGPSAPDPPVFEGSCFIQQDDHHDVGRKGIEMTIAEDN